jgi:3-hydroxyisobutyrate dehydrogenase-like beta-hydroxyacid dehydrogenase
MGQGMADNLLNKGADLMVFTRSLEKISAMKKKGAKGASSIEEISKETELIFICLPNIETSIQIVKEIQRYSNNVKLVSDHSTVSLQTSIESHRLLKEKGVSFSDAPISGGPTGAKDGTLSIMVGGNLDDYTMALPYYRMMGTKVKYMGNTGAGTAMKLINQLLTAVHTTAAAEAISLANAIGITITDAMEILSVSFGNSTMLERSAPIIRDKSYIGSPAPARNLIKDIHIVTELAKDLNLSLPLIKSTEILFDQYRNMGKEMEDIAGIIQLFEKNKEYK